MSTDNGVFIVTDCTREGLADAVKLAYGQASAPEPSVVVFGGQASGKTTHRELLARFYRLRVIVDDINPQTVPRRRTGVLYISPIALRPLWSTHIDTAIADLRCAGLLAR